MTRAIEILTDCGPARSARRPYVRFNAWSRRDLERLRALWPTASAEAIAQQLGRRRTAKAIASRAKVLRLRKAEGYGHRPWTEAEIEILRARYPHEPTSTLAPDLGRSALKVYAKANKIGLRKTPEYLATPAYKDQITGLELGAACRFHKGLVPWNKGRKMPGWAPGRMRATQFKKGQHPVGWKPIGSTRINADGYLDRKVADTGYPPHDWKGEHVLLWTEAHGPVPRGYIVVFKDRDKRHVALGNLECISLTENMRRNTIHNRYPPALRNLIMLNAALKRQIRRREEKDDATENNHRGFARAPVRADRRAS